MYIQKQIFLFPLREKSGPHKRRSVKGKRPYKTGGRLFYIPPLHFLQLKLHLPVHTGLYAGTGYLKSCPEGLILLYDSVKRTSQCFPVQITLHEKNPGHVIACLCLICLLQHIKASLGSRQRICITVRGLWYLCVVRGRICLAAAQQIGKAPYSPAGIQAGQLRKDRKLPFHFRQHGNRVQGIPAA